MPNHSKRHTINTISPLRNVGPFINELGVLAGFHEQHFLKKQNDFIQQINRDIKELNLLISDYNTSTVNRDQALIAIETAKKTIEEQYPNFCISACIDYMDNIQTTLSNQLQAGFAACGVQRTYPNALVHFISTASSEHLTQLIRCLDKLNSKGSMGMRLPNILDGYQFVKLKSGNNQNYIATDTVTSEQYIIKIENRMGMPRALASALEQKTGHIIAPYTSRPLSYNNNARQEMRITRNLQVLPYTPYGDLENFRRIINDTPDDVYCFALHLYSQMALIFLDLQQHGAAFTDAKNMNWLVFADADGFSIKIADSKALEPIDATTLLCDKKQAHNEWYSGYVGLLTTPALHPKEINKRQFNADALHVFLLGKNLYHFLRGVPLSYFKDHETIAPYGFHAPIFAKPLGQYFAILIQQMTNHDPRQRMTLQQVKRELDELTELTALNIPLEQIIAVKTVIAKFRRSGEQSKVDKALEIENALASIPITQRATVISDTESNAVQLALAKHRHMLGRLFNPNPARSLIELKKQFKKTAQDNSTDESPSNNNP
jgi:dsDNA-binding SOS-regulon protein